MFVDAAGWLIDNAPAGAAASGGHPNPLPAEFYVVQRTGGVAPNRVVDQPIITIEAYAKTKTRAFAIANDFRTWLFGLSGRHPALIIYWVREVGGPADLPDPLAPKHFRVTFAAELRLRARAV